MIAEQQINQWGQIVTKAWEDEKFKNRLLAEPAVVFKEFGIHVPAGVQCRVVENTDTIIHLTIPAQPREGELSDAELEGVAGGFGSLFDRLIRSLSGYSPREIENLRVSVNAEGKAGVVAPGLPPGDTPEPA